MFRWTVVAASDETQLYSLTGVMMELEAETIRLVATDGRRLAMATFFFSSRRRHTRCLSDWSSDVCSSDLAAGARPGRRPSRGGAGGPGRATRLAGPGRVGRPPGRGVARRRRARAARAALVVRPRPRAGAGRARR